MITALQALTNVGFHPDVTECIERAFRTIEMHSLSGSTCCEVSVHNEIKQAVTAALQSKGFVVTDIYLKHGCIDVSWFDVSSEADRAVLDDMIKERTK